MKRNKMKLPFSLIFWFCLVGTALGIKVPVTCECETCPSASPQKKSCQGDVIVAVDASTCWSGSQWDYIHSWTDQFVNDLESQSNLNVGVTSFSDTVSVARPIGGEETNDLEFLGGATKFDRVTNSVLEQFSERNNQNYKIVVLITNGNGYKENGADHATEDDIDALATGLYENDSVDLIVPVSITKVCTEESEEKINVLCPNLDMLSIWANKRAEMILPYSIRSATSRRNIKNEIFEFLGQGFKDTNGACKQHNQPKIDYDMTILVDGSDSIKRREWTDIKTALKSWVGGYQDSLVTIKQFSIDQRLEYGPEFPIDDNRWEDKIGRMRQMASSTFLQDALLDISSPDFEDLRRAKDPLSFDERFKILIVMSDGWPHNEELNPPSLEIYDLVVLVGIGDQIDLDLLKKLENRTNRKVIFELEEVASYGQLKSKLPALKRTLEKGLRSMLALRNRFKRRTDVPLQFLVSQSDLPLDPRSQFKRGLPNMSGTCDENGFRNCKCKVPIITFDGNGGGNSNNGGDGKDGEPGKIGPVGRSGKPGLRGDEGRRGDRGGAGQLGEQGVLGSQGKQGQQGRQGQRGEPGFSGPPGEPGVDGDGPEGPQGPPGPEGRRGQPGQMGFIGSPGRDGEPGCQGPDGEDGEPGIPGQRGEPGSRGQPGFAAEGQVGPCGPPGQSGRIGEQGLDGFDGQQGQDGEPGPRGQPGCQGPAGKKGETGNPGAEGDTGDCGKPGERGSPGTVGEPGANGSDGMDGFDGRPGPKGPRGSDRIDGTNGERGPPGIKGAQGNMGQMGTPGTDGVDGPMGEIGVAGDDGPNGAPGPRGDPGEPGRKGKQGIPGMPGDLSLEEHYKQIKAWVREKMGECPKRCESPTPLTTTAMPMSSTRAPTTQEPTKKPDTDSQTTELHPMHLVILLDGSDSIRSSSRNKEKDEWNNALEHIGKAMESFKIGERSTKSPDYVSFIQFSDIVSGHIIGAEVRNVEDRFELGEEIMDTIQIKKTTNTYKALDFVSSLDEQVDYIPEYLVNLLLVITDGEARDDKDEDYMQHVLLRVREYFDYVIPVGVGPNYDEEQLGLIRGKHMHGIVRTPTFEKLNEAMEPVNIKIETELEKAHILRRKKRTLKRRSERNKISFNTFL